jgi:isopentenyl-diphosphate delta-isomerase
LYAGAPAFSAGLLRVLRRSAARCAANERAQSAHCVPASASPTVRPRALRCARDAAAQGLATRRPPCALARSAARILFWVARRFEREAAPTLRSAKARGALTQRAPSAASRCFQASVGAFACAALRGVLRGSRGPSLRGANVRGWGTPAAGSSSSAAAMSAAAAPPPPAAVWNGSASQDALMQADCCAVVDECDAVIGHASKWAVHRFEGATPRGMLHRAFSVFLFNADGKLLLQRRAGSKITFPGVWTNTCCSHPLSGFTPSEIDAPSDVAAGAAPGATRAAVRKLGHELGIPAAQLPPGAFKFLTRLHYCAPDTETHGAASPWGEHEMDYILAARFLEPLSLEPNPEEVSDTRYVTQDELAAMMAPSSGLSWSPWFRIIAQRFLPAWWADLDATLNTDAHVDAATIHKVM